MKNTGQFDLDGAKCARQVTGILFSRPLQSATTMENTPLNVFILGSHALVLNGLKHKLQQKFGSTMATSIFCDVNSCMKKVDNLTHVLVIDELVEGRAAGDPAIADAAPSQTDARSGFCFCPCLTKNEK